MDDFFDGLDKAVETLRLGTSAERASALLQLSSELVASLDVRQALLSVGEAIRQLVQAERFMVVDDELRVTAARNGDGVDLATPLAHCAEIVRAAAKEKKVQFVHLPLNTAKWGAFETVKVLRLVGMIAVPLNGTRGLRGVIYADAQNGFAPQIDDATIEVITLLGQHAAQAVENAALMEQVAKDPGSDLLNATYFERRLGEELKRSTRYMRPFSLMFIELEGAAAWLSHYGKAGLDQMVRDVAAAVRVECRQTDVLARMGPARLGLLLPEMHIEGTTSIERFTPRDLAARIRGRLAQTTFKIGEVPQQAKISVGCVTHQEAPMVGLKGVLHEAELAIDVARKEGDDRFLVR
jgi:diguanylate cyclase (GGDEF)-like protein